MTEREQPVWVMLSLSSLQNYGVCALGLEKLAYLLMAYGFSASLCSSLALSMLRLRRQIPLLAGAFIHAALLVTLFCWAPQPRLVVQAPLLYTIAVLWGTGSALNKTSISSESQEHPCHSFSCPLASQLGGPQFLGPADKGQDRPTVAGSC